VASEVRFNETTGTYFRGLASDYRRPTMAKHYRRPDCPPITTRAAAGRLALRKRALHSSMLRSRVADIITGGYRSNVIPSEAKQPRLTSRLLARIR